MFLHASGFHSWCIVAVMCVGHMLILFGFGFATSSDNYDSPDMDLFVSCSHPTCRALSVENQLQLFLPFML